MVLTLASIVFTILCAFAAKAEFERVDQQSGGNASGSDYLAAHMMKGETVVLCIVSVINGSIAFLLGISAGWGKR